ncbi:hypothetical protein [Mycobacterium gordonae]|uniref:Uncharacterized protein n=1 Tax=Mycobacterium gordonae TaxID=1778 RepID=A0A1X1X990_MYCGO|nr:hypothetical protein [Mycobacterium gordonae]MCV7005654.1 hypothetical protein [Mycobacterium gordonae]ODR23508.1 hypothetical protein BHQ23_04605 [Mycobacterium gordonae]ORV95220.1 hypothetical protein AWC08_15325 [Mycobacterium gordonae]
MPTRTLGVALWNYRDGDGRRRRALFGQRFELSEDELARGERADVFAPEPEPAAAPGPAAPTGAAPLPPKQAAPKAAWVDYAEAIGIERAEAHAMSKPDLIDAVTTQLDEAT